MYIYVKKIKIKNKINEKKQNKGDRVNSLYINFIYI